MNKTTIRTALLTLCVCLVLASLACTKGRGVGGTQDNPAAVETAGVPEMPAHGAAAGHEKAADHEGPTSPADAHGTPTEPGTATSHEAVPTTPASQAPAAGDTAATTTGLGSHDTTGPTTTTHH
jgi:hypothetical protein